MHAKFENDSSKGVHFRGEVKALGRNDGRTYTVVQSDVCKGGGEERKRQQVSCRLLSLVLDGRCARIPFQMKS